MRLLAGRIVGNVMHRNASLSIGDVSLPLGGGGTSSIDGETPQPGMPENNAPSAMPAEENSATAPLPTSPIPTATIPTASIPTAQVSSAAVEEVEEIRVWSSADEEAQSATAGPLVMPVPEVPAVTEFESPTSSALSRLPAFLFSTLLHICVIIALALFMLPEEVRDALTITAMTEVQEPVQELPELEIPDLETVEPVELPQPVGGAPLGNIESDLLAPGSVSLDAVSDVSAVSGLDGLMQQVGSGGGFGDGIGGDFGARVAREGGQTGEVQVSLIWDDGNDLDLYVMAPSGEVIGYQNSRSNCGGQLDIDMNAGAAQSYEPVENILWAFGQAPGGKYAVAVKYFARHDGPAVTNFKIAVKRGEQVTETTGKIRRSEGLKKFYEFSYRPKRR